MTVKHNDLNSGFTIEEMIDEQVRREGVKPKPVQPLAAPVLARSHTAIYKMHRYWARRPHNVFARLIEHYSNPGDLILDPFCGGGVTVVEALKLRRRVVGIDINPLATWVTQVEVEPVDLEELDVEFHKWYDWVKESVSPLFIAECGGCGAEAQAEWYEWSNVVVCPGCGEPVVLAEAEKQKNAYYICTNLNCKARFRASGLERLPDKMMWVKTVCDGCGEKQLRRPLQSDLDLARKIEGDEEDIVKREKLFIPDDPFPDMDRERDDALSTKGILYFKDFLTSRQRIGIGRTRKWLENCDNCSEHLRCLAHVFSGMIRFTNKMVFRTKNWQGGNPIEWAGHNYWIPNIYNEINPEIGLIRKYNTLKRGKKQQLNEIANYFTPPHTYGPWNDLRRESSCWLLTQSSEKIPLPDEFIDVIITDPPFGGNVQYLELSDFYLVWLKRLFTWGGVTDKGSEAIETRHQGFEGAKDRRHYETLMYRIFKECRRVLKPDGWMVMTFHNRDIGVWMALHRAAQRAGFRMPSLEESPNRGMVYQPAIANYTQTIHQRATGSLLGDFILSFKPTDEPVALEAISQQLTLDEERKLQAMAEKIIRYHGGADEASLWTSLMPYLSETGILARVANFNLKLLLVNGPFQYIRGQKKWYMSDMFENGSLRAMDVIPVERLTQSLVYSYLSEKKQATIDDILTMIYSKLVNSQLPQISSIQEVLNRYCRKIKVKGEKREVFIWTPGKLTPQQEEEIRARQNSLELEAPLALDHNGIITTLARQAIAAGYEVHAGKTEQRKSPTLAELSAGLSGLELGLSPETFKYIREIDILILKNNNIQAAIEVVITIATINKAINDRFRNLQTIAPNLDIQKFIVVKDTDATAANSELNKPANVEVGLNRKVDIIKLSDLTVRDAIKRFLH